MKKSLFFLTIFFATILNSCSILGNKLVYYNKEKVNFKKSNKIVYFAPEIEPDIWEIQGPTYESFFNAATNETYKNENTKTLLMDFPMKYDSVDVQYLKEICHNNNAELAIVPKIKYLKVGLGKYVFSNQVLINLKLYNSEGMFLMETEYNTYKANARLLGKAENSVKIGTQGALKKMNKELRSKKNFTQKL